MVGLIHLKMFCLMAFGISAALALSGCAISNNVRPVLDGSGSSLSSSQEGGKDSRESGGNGYETEVQDFTVTYLRTNAGQTNQNAFMEGISDVASQNGIVDWEANPKTYRGIGKGLRKAKISGYQYEGYKKKFSNGDVGKMDDIQEGYGD
jgi:hypothetical protein